jgi:hypothetical protein
MGWEELQSSNIPVADTSSFDVLEEAFDD